MKKLIRSVALTALAFPAAQAVLAADMRDRDRDYITETAQGLMAEITLGGMASKQGQDERVRQFGKRMVDDHGKELYELKQIAAQKNVTLPDAPSPSQKKEADKLARLSTKAFDIEYVKYEAKDHKKDVKDQGKEMRKTTDPDLKKFAAASYETVVAHRKTIDAIHKTVGN